MARFEDQRASAQPTRRASRASSTVASAVTGLVRDGIEALRPRPEVTPAPAPAPRRGLFGRLFDALAAPIATAAVSVVPSMVRESREAERERAERRAAAAKLAVEHVEHMEQLRRRPAAPKAPAAIAAGVDVKLCDNQGCEAGVLFSDKRGRAYVQLSNGDRVGCRLKKGGTLTCAVRGRTMTGRVNH